MKKLVFFLLFILLTGCAHKQAVIVAKPKPMPAWYLNPPQSNNKIVYVTGGGISKKAAVLNALSNFVSRYSVTISSNFQTKLQDFGGGVANKNMAYNIKATVKKFEVSNYEIVKTERYKFDQFLVLIKVDIDKLYANIKNRLDSRFAEYKDVYNNILKENPLKQLIDLQKLSLKLENEKSYIYILKTMNQNFNSNQYLSFINKVKNRLDSLKNSIHIQISSNNFKITEDIKRYLTSNGIKVGNSQIKLIVNVKKRKSSMMNLVVYEVYLTTKYIGSIIGSNYFKIIAPQNADINGYLFNDIKNMSIEKFFNLK